MIASAKQTIPMGDALLGQHCLGCAGVGYAKPEWCLEADADLDAPCQRSVTADSEQLARLGLTAEVARFPRNMMAGNRRRDPLLMLVSVFTLA